jgi:integrase
MATYKKDGNVWRVQVYVNGERASATRTTKAQAQAWAAQKETELRQQKATGLVAGKTVKDAFDRYEVEVSKGKRGYRWEALRMSAMAESKIGDVKFGNIKLSELTAAHIGRWRDDRLKVVVGSTVNRDLNLLSHVLTTARREWAWIEESPTKDVRRPKDSPARDRRIWPDEIDRLCLALGFEEGEMATAKYQRVAVAFLFAIETAMRAGEICAMMPGDVSDQVAHLPRTKNGTSRDVPLSTRAVELLKLLPKGDGPLFGLDAESLSTMFRAARLRCLITDMTFHDSRHEAITRLAKKLDVLDLARMVGHKDLRMLLLYYNETAAQIAPRLG